MITVNPKSNHIREYSYDPASKQLSVQFHNGRTYTHVGVPQEAFDNMQRYRSAGEFYHGVIKRYALAKAQK